MSPTQSLTRKATLFCPECGHESAVDGDWLVREDDGVRAYECPDCGTYIDVRPRLGPEEERDGRTTTADVLAESGRLWLDLWNGWVDAWTPAKRRGSG